MKGSPGTVLHLTESSDARNGVGNDTIFHSSMPHVFITDEWVIPLTNMEPRWSSSVTQGNVVTPDNWLPQMKVGDIPLGAITALRDKTAVILTEVEYTLNGKTYRSIVNGWDINAEVGSAEASDYYDGWMYYYDYWACSSIRMGLSHKVAFGNGGSKGNIRNGIFSQDSYGFQYFRMAGYAEYSRENDARNNLWRSGYNTPWGNSFFKVETNKFPKMSYYGGSYNTVGVLPRALDCGFMENNSHRDGNNYNDYIKTLQSNNAGSSYNKRTWSSVSPSTMGTVSGWHGTRDAWYGNTGVYSGIVYTKVILKKLNLSYNGSAYSLQGVVPLTGEIRLDRNNFIVGGVNLKSLSATMLHQVNPTNKNRVGYNMLYCNYSMDTNLTTASKPVFPAVGMTTTGEVSVVNSTNAGVIARTGDNYIGTLTTRSSTGWVITSNSIADQGGVIWGGGSALPLRLLPNSTRSVTFGGTDIQFPNSQNKATVVATVDLGLPANRPSTIICNLSTTDIRLWLPNNIWYLPVSGNLAHTLQVDNVTPDTSVRGDHSIYVLPVNKYVPIMCTHTAGIDIGWRDYTSSAFSANTMDTTTLWLKNLGNGKVEVSLSNRLEMLAVRGGSASISNYSTKLYLPKFTLAIARLT